MDQRCITYLNSTKNMKLLVFLPFQKIHFSTVLFGPFKSKILGTESNTTIQKPRRALETAIYAHLRAGTATCDNIWGVLRNESTR